MIPKRIGRTIASLRRERQLSQADLAQRALVTTRTVGRIERGLTRPHPATLAVLCAALGVELADLQNGVDPGDDRADENP